MYTANSENKKLLTDAIDEFKPIGATDMLYAFKKAFQILENSISEELIVTCGGGVPGNLSHVDF